MKVFALGGHGKVGFVACKLLAQSDLVTEIAVAGRSLERAEKAAAEIGEKGIAVRADGTDEDKMASFLAGYDIIVNAAYENTVLPTIRAAIRTGTHYCDVNLRFIDQALKLASEAASAGVTSILANGIGPGISNTMGVHMARQLDEVEQFQRGLAPLVDFQSGQELTPRQWLIDPEGCRATLHKFRPFIVWILGMLQKCGIRTVRDYQDGRWVEVNPIRSGLDVPHLEGGTIISYPFVSSDLPWRALPRDLCEAPPVEMWFSALPSQLDTVLREQALSVPEENIDPETAANAFYKTADSDPHRELTLPDVYMPVPMMWVRAVGRKAGRAARCTCWFTDPIWDVGGLIITSAALVVAARKIMHGEIRERGIVTAETCFEPQSFFDEMVAVLPELPPDGRLIDESFEWLE